MRATGRDPQGRQAGRDARPARGGSARRQVPVSSAATRAWRRGARALLLASLLGGAAVAQQPQSLNLGGQQAAPSSGNWLTRHLPWGRAKGGAPLPQFRPSGGSETIAAPPRDVSPEQKFQGQLALARLSEKRGKDDEAKKMYETLAQRNPQRGEPLHRLGVIAARSGDTEKGEQLLRRAIKIRPQDPDLYRDLGYLFHCTGRNELAEQAYREGLEIDGDHQAICNNFGLLLVEQQRYDDALAVFERANKPAEAHANLGYALTQIGNLELAQQHYNQALTLDPKLKPAAEGLLQTEQWKQAVVAAQRREAQQAAAADGAAPSSPPAVASTIPSPTRGAARVSLSDEEDVPGVAIPAVARLTDDQGASVQPTSLRESPATVGGTPAPRPDRSLPPRTERSATSSSLTPLPTRQAPPARRLDPIRVGNTESSSETSPATPPPVVRGRKVVGVQGAVEESSPVDSADHATPVPGPARARRSLRIDDTQRPSSIESSNAAPAATPILGDSPAPFPTPLPGIPASDTTYAPPPLGAGFDTSASHLFTTHTYPTSRPTWTGGERPVPAALLPGSDR